MASEQATSLRSTRVRIAAAVSSLFGIGHLRPAPGTWGSLAALLPGVLVMDAFGSPALLLGALILWAIGYLAVRDALAGSEAGDPDWIVIDEAAGQWLALSALPAFTWPGVVLAFLLFRAFDILKPWPISWADEIPGARGVMLDDMLAGALSASVLFVVTLALPSVLAP